MTLFPSSSAESSDSLSHAGLPVLGSLPPTQAATKLREQGETYDPTNGQVAKKANLTQLIPYNYVMFGVRRSNES